MMRIAYLCDHISFADTVARWIFDEFISGIRNDLPYENVLASFKNCRRQEFPIRFIALIDDQCIGTVSLVFNDLKCREYTPWLAALYVDKNFRNKKIGERLISRVKNAAMQLGYSRVYLRTEHTGDYYRKSGREYVETCDDNFDLKPDVFVFNLVK